MKILVYCFLFFATTTFASKPVEDYFREYEDLTSLKWKNGVNTEALLNENLKDEKIHIIQADVYYFRLNSKDDAVVKEKDATTGIRLADYLRIVIDHNTDPSNKKLRKALRLDFKETRAYQLAVVSGVLLNSAQVLRSDIDFPLIISADVIQGPGGDSPAVNLDATSLSKMPTITVALGWTGPTSTTSKSAYTEEQLRNMENMLVTLGIAEFYDITYNVRAINAAETEKLKELVDDKTTLTIWSSDSEEESKAVDVDKLKDIYKKNKDRVYHNLPAHLQDRLGNSAAMCSPMIGLSVIVYIITKVL